MRRIWLAVGVLFVAGIVPVGRSAPPAAKRDALLAADRAFDAATAERKIEGFSSFLADNVSTLRADQPVLRGKTAPQNDWKSQLENSSISLRWQPISAEISKSGDLGYTVGSYVMNRTDEKGMVNLVTIKRPTVCRLQNTGGVKGEFDTGVPHASPATQKPQKTD